MVKFTKKQFALFSVALIALIAGTASILIFCEKGLFPSFNGDDDILRIHLSYAVDVSNPYELVGDADYVFAAKVDKMVGNTYNNPFVYSHTNYMITVLDNIKGELVADESIPIEKSGGLGKDGKTITLHENDSLPEVGKVYVFLAYAQPDGTLLIAGPNSNIEIGSVDSFEADSVFSIRESPEYLKMIDAYENQIVRERGRMVSIYDANAEN